MSNKPKKIVAYKKKRGSWKRKAQATGAMAIPVATGLGVTYGKDMSRGISQELKRHINPRTGKPHTLRSGIVGMLKSKKFMRKVLPSAKGLAAGGVAAAVPASIAYALSNEAYLRARPKGTK